MVRPLLEALEHPGDPDHAMAKRALAEARARDTRDVKAGRVPQGVKAPARPGISQRQVQKLEAMYQGSDVGFDQYAVDDVSKAPPAEQATAQNYKSEDGADNVQIERGVLPGVDLVEADFQHPANPTDPVTELQVFKKDSQGNEAPVEVIDLGANGSWSSSKAD